MSIGSSGIEGPEIGFDQTVHFCLFNEEQKKVNVTNILFGTLLNRGHLQSRQIV